MKAFYPFYTKLYNAVLAAYLRRQRQEVNLSNKERRWLDTKFSSLDEATTKRIVQRWVSFITQAIVVLMIVQIV